MRRLTGYLVRLFAMDATILFGVVCLLLWMVNLLRSFDVVAAKGQNMGTLAYQALLALPQLSMSFFYICVGIGLARGFQALQTNKELHIVHTSSGLGSIWRATAAVAGIGMLLALLLSNVIEPLANKRLNILAASIAADLVSSTLKPERFTQVTPGVVLLIGGRFGNGEITEFFADDRRDPETRRTYIAESARVSTDGEGYVIELMNGSLQYTEANGRFSKITFGRYDLNVDQLAQPTADLNSVAARDSVSLVVDALDSGTWSTETVNALTNRFGEGLRVLGMCLLVLAAMGFPSGRRGGFGVPMEAVVLLVAFVERGISTYSPLGPLTGSTIMIAVAGAILIARARPRRIARVGA